MKSLSPLAFATLLAVSAAPIASATSPSCTQSSLRMTVQNLTGQTQEGYIADQASSAFSVAPKGTQEVTVQTATIGNEHRVEIYLSDASQYQDLETDGSSARRCVGLIELPTGCATDAPAGRLYIYKTTHGDQCFVRTVARPPRASSAAIALKK